MRWWLLAAGCGALAAVVGGVFVANPMRPPLPDVNHAQARAMLPAIEKYLDSPAGGNLRGGVLAVHHPKLKPRTFCTAAIIEIRRAGSRWRVGMVTWCEEYARQGHALVSGTAGGGYEVMVLAGAAGGHYRVVSAVSDFGPPAPDPGWVNRHFSRGAAREINSGHFPGPPDPVAQAGRFFGFPPGTQAVSAEPHSD